MCGSSMLRIHFLCRCRSFPRVRYHILVGVWYCSGTLCILQHVTIGTACLIRCIPVHLILHGGLCIYLFGNNILQFRWLQMVPKADHHWDLRDHDWSLHCRRRSPSIPEDLQIRQLAYIQAVDFHLVCWHDSWSYCFWPRPQNRSEDLPKCGHHCHYDPCPRHFHYCILRKYSRAPLELPLWKG